CARIEEGYYGSSYVDWFAYW
nr:immunoglobulin heavy chain junction region [Mus musculus]MBK4187479.1 immunoglobulin heavy chain junction region [Mus musculus]MBK4187485.1 immunoglobulin heavy chain junction region [Mus musculus]MBK4187489.1 immunoglobulin heavy chain junction region [Mus musculus]MBK4187490.1 immunoglobulin heavy chain junction region [Mus musculus]